MFKQQNSKKTPKYEKIVFWNVLHRDAQSRNQTTFFLWGHRAKWCNTVLPGVFQYTLHSQFTKFSTQNESAITSNAYYVTNLK